MSVVIRLSRGGRSNLAAYQIVVADSRRASTGKFIERLGYFHPHAKGEAKNFVLDETKLTEWVGKGAQVSNAVTRLLMKHNMGPAKVKEAFQAYKVRRAKAQAVAAAEAARRQPKEGADNASVPGDAAQAAAPAAATAEPAPAAEAPKAE